MNKNLSDLTTFDLAFNLASGIYNEQEKFEVLKIIKDRELNVKDVSVESKEKIINNPNKAKKPPLPGSKAEKIQKLLNAGKTAKEILESLNKKGIKVYYPEIYRLRKSSEPVITNK
jgi:hypothetical protein